MNDIQLKIVKRSPVPFPCRCGLSLLGTVVYCEKRNCTALIPLMAPWLTMYDGRVPCGVCGCTRNFSARHYSAENLRKNFEERCTEALKKKQGHLQDSPSQP